MPLKEMEERTRRRDGGEMTEVAGLMALYVQVSFVAKAYCSLPSGAKKPLKEPLMLQVPPFARPELKVLT